jgi:hypothetical protein
MIHPEHKILKDFKRIILSDLALHWFFNEYDVYHSSNCTSDFLLKDCGFNSKKSLRKSWVFGNTGFLSEMNHYYSFASRISEFTTVKDNPNSLRQKLNILHIMNECDFEPNNPIHISIFSVFDKTKNILDLDDKRTWNNFNIAVHPGHTRVVGSVFLNENIKNNFIYVNKKNNFKIKGKNVTKVNVNNFKEYFIDKFERKKDLDVYYKCFAWPEKDMILKDTFKTSYNSDEGFPIQILKLYLFFQYKNQNLYSKSIGNSYIYNTFTYCNLYFKILFNKKVNIYSLDKEETYNLFFTNLKNLFDPNIHNNELRNLFSDFIQNDLYLSDAMIAGLENVLDIFDENEKEILLKFKKFIREIQPTIKPNHKIDSNPIFTKTTYHKVVKNNDTFSNIALKNDYEGFAVFIDNTKINLSNFERTLPELLYIANPTVSIVRSIDNEFAIINCEHEYWKTNNNYQEIIIQKSFYET